MPNVLGNLHSLRRRAPVWLLGSAVAANAIIRGGIDLPTIGATLFVSATALVVTLRRANGPREPGERTTRFDIPVLPLLLGVAAFGVALQLVPLPPATLQALSPAAVTVFEDSLAPIGLWPAWRPISLDPGETALHLAMAMSIAAACAAAALACESRRRTEIVVGALAASGFAVSAISLGAAAAGVGPLLESRVTFVNPNNFAGFLQLAAWPALGFGLRATGRARLAWLVAFAFAAAGIFLSLSRAGIVAFFGSAAVWVVLTLRSGHGLLAARREYSHPSARGPREVARSAAVPVTVFVALAAASWLALGRILSEMATLSHAASDLKIALWPHALTLIRRFPLVGIGRGAFATLYPTWKSTPEQVTFTHIENSWLQVPLDLGLPLGIALLGCAAWAFVSAARSSQLSRPFIGALSGVAGVAAQNLFDFSFDIPGVALPLALVLGIASRSMPRLSVRPRVLYALAASTVLLGSAGICLNARHGGEGVAASIARAPNADLAASAAADALRWHPADWLPHAAMGVVLVHNGKCAVAMPWLVRAMGRSPTSPEPHHYAARCLAASGQDEFAKREYRLAHLFGDWTSLREAFVRYPGPGELLDIVPQTPEGLLAASSILADRPDEAREAYRRLWEGFLDTRGLAGFAETTLKVGREKEALELARELRTLDPLHPQSYVVASEALTSLGDEDAARTELDLGASRLPGNAAIFGAIGLRELASKHPGLAKTWFDRIVARTGPEIARKKVLIARALAAQGRTLEALREAQDAAATDRSYAFALEALARYAAAAGQFEVAVDALERAMRMNPARAEVYGELLRLLREKHSSQELRRAGDGDTRP